ncbi:hypothetical protein B1J94_13610 [Leptospira kirschneri serovar Grippotyphosa]|nr:hypothetical protein B1J94_13610 [Leptospira kirschneri serovar Grippotyphosa]
MKYHIMFLSCNLLTEAESTVRQRQIHPNFFTLNFTLLKHKRFGILLHSSQLVVPTNDLI